MSIRQATYEEVVEQCGRLARQWRRLRPDQPQIAAFDADGTLWEEDVADLLWDHLVEGKALTRQAAAPLARTVRAAGEEPTHDPYEDYQRLKELSRRGRCPEETMVRVMLQGLAGLTEEAIYLHAQKALARARGISGVATGPSALMIARLRDLGYRVVVVSGSPRWAVEVAVKPLGMDTTDIVAGQVAVVSGALTDGVIEPLPHGPGKIQAILRRFGTVPHVSVGNGLGDLEMLEAASHLKLLVNPTDALLKACEDGAAYVTPRGEPDLAGAATGRGPTIRSRGVAAAGAGTSTPKPRPRARR